MSRDGVAARLEVAAAGILVLLDLLAVVSEEAAADLVHLVDVVAVLGVAVDQALAPDLVARAGPVAREHGEQLAPGERPLLEDGLLDRVERVGEVGGAHALDAGGVVARASRGDVRAALEGVVHER